MEKKIGFIGLGVMGKSMAGHLMDAGHELYVYSRTKAKCGDIIEKGAHWCDTPKGVAENTDIVFTIVGFPKDVEEVYLGENGIIEGTREGMIFCDMTTTKPSLDIQIGKELEKKGASMCDAPVSGGDSGARNATLSIMAGADKATFDALLPYFNIMGKSITHMGGLGAGQHTKMANHLKRRCRLLDSR